MTLAVLVFALVYVGMFLGKLPRLKLDRTGIALLGGIAMVAGGAVSMDEAVAAVDIATLTLLFAMMVVSAQLRCGGFYTRVTLAIVEQSFSPAIFLAAVIAAAGVLAAVFSNDVVCLAMAPILLSACRRRGLDPAPFLLALACAANVGSAATLIGNPQNMLIGQALDLSFAGYMVLAAPLACLGLVATWLVVVVQVRGRWQAVDALGSSEIGMPAHRAFAPDPLADAPAFRPWQSIKGLAVAAFLFWAFLFEPWPREVVALAGAGVLLMSRELHSREMLALVDWQLLVLFIGLFVVNRGLELTGLPQEAVTRFDGAGIGVTHPATLFVATVVMSNVVSNVPAVMLLLPFASHELGGPILALASTLAGNLLIVGSIANIIVVDIAARHGVGIDWRRHVHIGVPVTLVTLAIAAAGLVLHAWRPV